MLTRYGVPCGIAQQAEYLAPELRRLGVDLSVLSAGPAQDGVTACWREPFGRSADDAPEIAA